MRPHSNSTRSRSGLPALPARAGVQAGGPIVTVVALALTLAAVSGCVGKSGAVYSRPGADPSQNPDATPGVDAPGPPDGLLPDVPGPDLSIGGPDVPAGSPCADNVVDGTETDIDCGGAACGPCANGKRCALPTDCAGSVCTGGLCQAVGCANLVKDATETDVDCGGVTCSPCAQGKHCLVTGDCASGTCTAGVCETPSCTDHLKNGTETDVDCGGALCPPCGPQQGCAVAGDCMSGVCAAAKCAVPSCTDQIQDGLETGKDCGGDCPGCASGQGCHVAGDCMSGVCTAAVCVAATCMDMARNGTETDVDCGGTCPVKCATGKGCALATDCAGGACTGGVCQAAGCADKIKNGTETDLDCGGASCAACLDGRVCVKASDCDSGVCTAGVCAAPSCSDGIKNGTETDVNCGGACPGCAPPLKCKTGGDCASLVCTSGACVAPACTDKVQNGMEVDVDCGGTSTCGKCANGKMCKTAADCTSGSCGGGLCLAPSCSDGLKNGTETDMDCGGGTGCSACDDGKVCKVAADCVSAVCPTATLKCAVPTCADGAKNGAETDADCGGPCVSGGKRCADGKGCATGGDCTSAVCGPAMKCMPVACTDLTKNGTETDVDCGGSCTAKCALGKMCGTSNANCATGLVCSGGVCAAPTCTDAMKDGMETDLNCGGPDCAKCADGKVCLVAGDCASGVCSGTTAKTCAVPSCTDTVKNGMETDADCGGACTAKCADGKMCALATDCASGVCTNGTCAVPSCTDTVKNGTETDLNCGGAMCMKCANGKGCAAAGDCSSGVCSGTTAKTCAVPTCSDGVKNGTETDRDCGGSCAPALGCDAGQMCSLPTDCKSSNCTAMMCMPGGCQTCWKVQYQYTVVAVDNKWSGQNFNIVKTGTSTTPLSDLKIRYWFAAKRAGSFVSECFSFPSGNTNVVLTFKAVSPARPGADTYMEVGFKSGTNWGSGASGTIQTGFHFSDWAVFTFPNGYSSDPSFTSLKDDPKVTLYDAAGNLVWGTEPPACPAGTTCP